MWTLDDHAFSGKLIALLLMEKGMGLYKPKPKWTRKCIVSKKLK
jgi:hypothetical protein